MSEPIQKGEIDLKSLDQALNDAEAASELPAKPLQTNSDTLAQPPADARSLVGSAAPSAEHAQKVSSPTTLSPSSPRAMSPAPTSTQPASAAPPAVAELKVMFPDLDNDTIAAVLSSRGGNQESAVNALLQMSDPNFKLSTTETRTDSDALLAQTLAIEEEQRQHQRMARQQHHQQQQQHVMGRGGGGAGSFFSGLLNSDARGSFAPSAPAYDPNALTYQPRIRRGPPANPGAAGARMSQAPSSHSSGTVPSYGQGESVIPGMPGAKEAKQWQEEINRMAETGLARAASTFSSFRQKASAAFNNPQEGASGSGQSASDVSGGSGNGAGAGFAQAFHNFRNTAGRGSNSAEQQTTAPVTSARRGFTSPRSPHASEYDQDPSPVSENELAKIISRGGGGGSVGGASFDKSQAGKARALAERYGLGIKDAGRASPVAAQSAAGSASAGASDFAGWDQAGRTPISIKDNTTSSAGEANKSIVDSVALMDSARGRGITSPRPGQSPTKETPPTSRTSGSAAGVAATVAGVGAAGVGAATLAKHDADDPNDDDSDDLEYVSNPFEDED